MMCDSSLYSGDEAVIVSELLCCCVAAKQCSGEGSEGQAGVSVGTSLALAPECGLTFPQYMLKACTCIYVNPHLIAWTYQWPLS